VTTQRRCREEETWRTHRSQGHGRRKFGDGRSIRAVQSGDNGGRRTAGVAAADYSWNGILFNNPRLGIRTYQIDTGSAVGG
jgi:hypothetical protein